MHPGILSISEVDSPARATYYSYDYGYEKLIERGGKSVRAKSFLPSRWHRGNIEIPTAFQNTML